MSIHADQIAVSTWSLHRWLGTTYPHDLTTKAVGAATPTYGAGHTSLLGLLPELVARDYRRLEIVSFHIPSRDRAYLHELRTELRLQGVTLQTLLIDDGDITHPEFGSRDQQWIAGWIEVANELGAENARIIAGKQKPNRQTLDRSAGALLALARGNEGAGLRLVTENWLDLLSGPDQVRYLLNRLEGQVGLMVDFGNWHSPNKYADLQSIFHGAELCHAKAEFLYGKMDENDFGKCVAAAEGGGYAGRPYTLIFSDDSDEWDGLAAERSFLVAGRD